MIRKPPVVFLLTALWCLAPSAGRSLSPMASGHRDDSSIGQAIDLRASKPSTLSAKTSSADPEAAGLPPLESSGKSLRSPSLEQESEAASAVVTLNLEVSFKDSRLNIKPARSVKVEVWDKDELSPDDLLDSAFTDNTGKITFNVDSADTEPFSGYQDIYFKIWCTNDRVDVDNGINTYVSFSNPQWNLAPGTHPFSYGVAEGQNGPFNIHDVITKGSQFLSLYDSQVAKVDVVWPYDIAGLLSYYNDAINTIFLEGGLEYNSTVILHEYGHFVMDIYADFFPAFPSYGADLTHQWDSHETQVTAWLEGWASFLGAATRDYWYLRNQGWSDPIADQVYNLETSANWPGQSNRDDVESAAAAILWDIYDPDDDPGDTLYLMFAKIWDVFHNYDPLPLDPAHNHPWTIHEFWNGWFARGYGHEPEMWAIFDQHGVRKPDTVPPGNPSSILSTTHAIGAWSNNQTISFTWSGATDNLSGVSAYAFKVDNSASSVPDTFYIFTATSWSFSGLSSTAFPYYFHIKTQDHAGNWSNSTAHNGPYYIDAALPSSPTACAEIHGTANNTWQNSITSPEFTWSGASDALSGILDYSWIFGTSSSSYPSARTSSTGCKPLPVISNGVYYLRVLTNDKAGNPGSPATLFTFKYDGTPPATGSIAIDGNNTYTNSTSVTLTLASSDHYSGICQMRIYNEGLPSILYEPYSNTKAWGLRIQALGESGTKTVMVFFKDCAGNETAGFSDSIILDQSAPAGSVRINSGASQTNRPQVTLNLSASDNLSGVAQMRFANAGFPWTGWETFGTSKSWTLAPGIGSRSVSAQFRDGAGNISVTYSASITLTSYSLFLPMLKK